MSVKMQVVTLKFNYTGMFLKYIVVHIYVDTLLMQLK